MSLVSYRFLPTTTLTSVTLLDGEIDNDTLFHLLPVTYFILNKSYYKKIPTCNVKGAILSLRYKKMSRGFPKETCFKNSVMIVLSMGNKNVSFKVSNKKFQLCGATSEKMGEEACQIMLAYILRIQELLDLMHSNMEETQRTIDWVLENTKFPTMFQNRKVELCKPPDLFSLYKPLPLLNSSVTLDKTNQKETKINETLARWFIPMMSDYQYHSDYTLHLTKYLVNVENVILSSKVSLLPMEVKMKNHNYWIPFMIHRQKLYELFSSLKNWISIYDASWDTSVKILRLSNEQKIKYEDEEEVSDQYHTFIIFSTGSVTQSVPNPKEIGLFYEEFNRIVRENKPTIQMNTKRILRRKIKIPYTNSKIICPAPPFQNVCTL